MTAFWNDFATFMWVRAYNGIDLLKTMACYWWKPRFALVDCSLLLGYFFKSPYRISREFNAQEPYGETPLCTLAKLVKACPISADDVVYELGSGRGRSCFWFALYKGVRTVGIENNPTFTRRAKALAAFFRVNIVQFRLEELTQTDLTGASWIYLYGTALPDEVIMSLAKRFETLKAGTKVITISYSLTEYVQSTKFRILHIVDVDFAWGTTQAYIHEIV